MTAEWPEPPPRSDRAQHAYSRPRQPDASHARGDVRPSAVLARKGGRQLGICCQQRQPQPNGHGRAAADWIGNGELASQVGLAAANALPAQGGS
jgi:hypothetical protein